MFRNHPLKKFSRSILATNIHEWRIIKIKIEIRVHSCSFVAKMERLNTHNLLECGNEALDPSQNGSMYDRDAALLHQIAHVAITQLVSDIPSYGLNDQEVIEMAAFEELRLLRRKLGHAEDYP